MGLSALLPCNQSDDNGCSLLSDIMYIDIREWEDRKTNPAAAATAVAAAIHQLQKSRLNCIARDCWCWWWWWGRRAKTFRRAKPPPTAIWELGKRQPMKSYYITCGSIGRRKSSPSFFRVRPNWWATTIGRRMLCIYRVVVVVLDVGMYRGTCDVIRAYNGYYGSQLFF